MLVLNQLLFLLSLLSTILERQRHTAVHWSPRGNCIPCSPIMIVIPNSLTQSGNFVCDCAGMMLYTQACSSPHENFDVGSRAISICTIDGFDDTKYSYIGTYTYFHSHSNRASMIPNLVDQACHIQISGGRHRTCQHKICNARLSRKSLAGTVPQPSKRCPRRPFFPSTTTSRTTPRDRSINNHTVQYVFLQHVTLHSPLHPSPCPGRRCSPPVSMWMASCNGRTIHTPHLQ